MVSKSLLSRGLNSLECTTTHPRVTIDIDDRYPGDSKVYTTFDAIEGTVIIEVDHETSFHDIGITLEGQSSVSVERIDPVLGQRAARHTFLRLRQPIDPDLYPASKVLSPGVLYRIPFLFIIPERLLPQSCDHEVSDSHVRQTHTQLPPAFGDSTVHESRLNDIASDTCAVSYAIRARILKKPLEKESYNRTIAVSSREVRVVPSTDQELLCKASDKGLRQTIRREKLISNGLIRGHQGHLVATAFQPEPVLLDYTGISTNTVDAATVIYLRFDPKADEQPPRLSTLRSRLGVRTFYGSSPWANHPTNAADLRENHQDMALEHVPLSSFSIASTEWTKHFSSNDSAYPHPPTGPSEPEPLLQTSDTCNGNVYYTTSISVPIYLPKDKQFVSTFYSCLISRIYTLDLSLSYHTSKTRFLRHSINLKVPVTLNVSVPGLCNTLQDVPCRKEATQSCSLQEYDDECEKFAVWD